jgi:hypothetical protein
MNDLSVDIKKMVHTAFQEFKVSFKSKHKKVNTFNSKENITLDRSLYPIREFFQKYDGFEDIDAHADLHIAETGNI